MLSKVHLMRLRPGSPGEAGIVTAQITLPGIVPQSMLAAVARAIAEGRPDDNEDDGQALKSASKGKQRHGRTALRLRLMPRSWLTVASRLTATLVSPSRSRRSAVVVIILAMLGLAGGAFAFRSFVGAMLFSGHPSVVESPVIVHETPSTTIVPMQTKSPPVPSGSREPQPQKPPRVSGSSCVQGPRVLILICPALAFPGTRAIRPRHRSRSPPLVSRVFVRMFAETGDGLPRDEQQRLREAGLLIEVGLRGVDGPELPAAIA
jgi:hypothetical protein